MSDDLQRARARRDRRRSAAPVGAFRVNRAPQIAIDRTMHKIRAAEIASGRLQPTPERITMALDLRGLDGPEVDIACGVEEPTVDEWEAGTRTPTREQVEALGHLTGFPPGFFYQAAPAALGQIILCGEGGCQVIESNDEPLTADVVALPGTDGRLF